MSTPTKENKRCHVASGQTPNEKKRNRPERVGSRKSLDYKATDKSATEVQSHISKSPCIRRVLQRRIVIVSNSPKRNRSPKKVPWTHAEDVAIVQFVALHKDEQSSPDKDWPAMRAESNYWNQAAQYIQSVTGVHNLRKAQSVRQRVVNHLRKKFGSIDEAEDAFGLSLEYYLESASEKENATTVPLDSLPEKVIKVVSKLTANQLSLLALHILQNMSASNLQSTLHKVLPKVLPSLCVADVLGLLASLSKTASRKALLDVADSLVCSVAAKSGISWTLNGFLDILCRAMCELEAHGKPNVVYFLSRCIADKKEDGKTPILSLDRMPFGLIQYQLEFFNATHIRQVSEPDDFRMWRETMENEFGGGKFKRLFRGPMWSSCTQDEIGFTQKAKVNVACISTRTQNKRNQQSTFTGKPEVQVTALQQLKAANPDGRFWIKVDGTDIKPALLESMRKEWNGDVDLGNGNLLTLRHQYDERSRIFKEAPKAANRHVLQQSITSVIDSIDSDVEYLIEGLEKATKLFREKMRRTTTSEETLRCLNWEVVEFQVLLEQSNNWLTLLTDLLGQLRPDHPDHAPVVAVLKDSQSDMALYLRNIFKKRRQPAATHVLVLMVSDERRNRKPYALPVQFIPYHSLRDQYIRDFTKVLKQNMVQLGLQVVGTVSDGEFVTLRSRGETRSVHIWQLIHDAKSSVSKLSKQKLLDMLVLQGVNPDGMPKTRRINPAIPSDVITEIFNLQYRNGLSLQDAIANIRGSLVPHGYTPWPYKHDTPESMLDMLRSIVATFEYRHVIKSMKEEFGADFTTHLYVPEIDPVTGIPHHERGDHNHILKRVAGCTRNGNNQDLNYEAFVEAMRSPNTGLTYTALAGKRKQSVGDAERLLSYHVAEFFRQKGYEKEYEYTQTIAQWHEASDGRGISQLQRCRYNFQMLNYILDEWMPWHRDNYDFSTIDINRPVEYMRGFTREVVIEITANIESQELRRSQTDEIGYPEHPRAGSTEDLECFFGVAHCRLGNVFTLKEFKDGWPKLVSENSKRLNSDTLPYYYWTQNERFHEGSLDDFDVIPGQENNGDGGENEEFCENVSRRNPLRLHRLIRNQRESVAHFVPGRAFLPARNERSVRQQHHRPRAGVPPPSGFLFPISEENET